MLWRTEPESRRPLRGVGGYSVAVTPHAATCSTVTGARYAAESASGPAVTAPPCEPVGRVGSEGCPKSRRYRNRGGDLILNLLRRLWIPLVMLAVIGVGGMTVLRLHSVFGSDRRPSYADTNVNNADPVNLGQLTYEVFGAPGTVADISYFDMNGDPQLVHAASLPWSVKFPAPPAAFGSVVAQGDSGTIGCRIVVDGVVKAEKVTNQPSAFTFCLLKPT